MTKKYIINKVNNKTLEKLNKKIIKKIITTKNNKYIVYFYNEKQLNFYSLIEMYNCFKHRYKLEKNKENYIFKKNIIVPFKKIENKNEIYLNLIDNIKKILKKAIFSNVSDYIKELNIEEELYKNKNFILKINKEILKNKIKEIYNKEKYNKEDNKKYINIIMNIIENIK